MCKSGFLHKSAAQFFNVRVCGYIHYLSRSPFTCHNIISSVTRRYFQLHFRTCHLISGCRTIHDWQQWRSQAVCYLHLHDPCSEICMTRFDFSDQKSVKNCVKFLIQSNFVTNNLIVKIKRRICHNTKVQNISISRISQT